MSRSKIPGPHVEQNGCHDCGYVFRKGEFDCGDTYFCAFEPTKRPPCCSVAMGEYDFERSMRELDDEDAAGQFGEWESWSAGRAVQPWGMCPRWKEPSDD